MLRMPPASFLLLRFQPHRERYTDFANIRRIQILRGGKTIDVDAKEFEQNPQKDIPIENGDIIIVPRSFLG